MAKLVGLSTLRIKECDRIAAPQAEFRRIGLEFYSGPDWVEIPEICPAVQAHIADANNIAECETYHDHRMAMSLAVLGTKLPHGVVILEPGCVGETFPEFWERLERVCN